MNKKIKPSGYYKKYGINQDIYDELLELQQSKCMICQKEHINQKHQKLCVDHDHQNGRIRGLLCKECNWALGHIKDNEFVAHRMYLYLKINNTRHKTKRK